MAKVKVTYQRAERKSIARRLAEEIILPDGLSPLARYVEDNIDSGVPVPELIWQFQEYDCEHNSHGVLAKGKSYIYWCCENCGRIDKQRVRK